MTRTRKNEIVVGIFVIVALGALLWMTVLIRGTTGINPLVLHTEFEDVAGLEIGSPVLVSGFRLGRVTEMEPSTTPEGGPSVIVTMKVARKIPIHADATAKLAQQGFVGDMRIEIHPGLTTEPLVNDGDTLVPIPPTDFAKLLGAGEEMLADAQASVAAIRKILDDQERIATIDSTIANIQSATERLNRMLADNEEDFRATMANARQISDQSATVMQKGEDIVNNVNNRIESIGNFAQETMSDIRSTFADAKGRIDSILGKTDTAADNANELITSSQKEMEQLSASLQETSDSLRDLIEKINSGEGTVGLLLNDPRPFNDLQQSISALRKMLLGAQERPYDLTLEYQQAGAPRP